MKIEKNISLKDKTSMRVGGLAKYYCEVETRADLEEAVKFSQDENLEILTLGSGSNTIVTQKGFDGLVLRLKNDSVDFEESGDNVIVKVGAGKDWDEFVGEMVDRNLQGVECLSYIPGTMGAAPVQNIGAYGQELSDTFIELEAYDTKKSKFIVLSKEDCKFEYRGSIFKKERGRYLIFSVTLALVKDGKTELKYKDLINYFEKKGEESPTLSQIRESVIETRKRKLEDPAHMPNTGSFFKNPIISQEDFDSVKLKYPEVPFYEDPRGVKIPAGWLIEQCGWKGKSLGKVKVSDKHALVLTNPDGSGNADDIFELAGKIKEDVKSKFDIDLEMEPIVV